MPTLPLAANGSSSIFTFDSFHQVRCEVFNPSITRFICRLHLRVPLLYFSVTFVYGEYPTLLSLTAKVLFCQVRNILLQFGLCISVFRLKRPESF